MAPGPSLMAINFLWTSDTGNCPPWSCVIHRSSNCWPHTAHLKISHKPEHLSLHTKDGHYAVGYRSSTAQAQLPRLLLQAGAKPQPSDISRLHKSVALPLLSPMVDAMALEVNSLSDPLATWGDRWEQLSFELWRECIPLMGHITTIT